MRLRIHIPALLLCLLASLCAQAQDYCVCATKYFAGSRKVSTTECYDKDNRWGKARAFNRNGQQIYERDLRRVAGHSAVEFSYYESGALKAARWSSAPDGGIQWYRSLTTFSEDGKVTSDTRDSYDERVPGMVVRKRPGEHVVEKQAPVRRSTVAECAVIYASEFWFTNHTPHTVIVTTTGKYNRADTFTLSLEPKETLKGGQLILAQQFDDPAKTFDFSATPQKPGKKQRFVIIPSDERQPENPSKEVRRYYYEVRRVI